MGTLQNEFCIPISTIDRLSMGSGQSSREFLGEAAIIESSMEKLVRTPPAPGAACVAKKTRVEPPPKNQCSPAQRPCLHRRPK